MDSVLWPVADDEWLAINTLLCFVLSGGVGGGASGGWGVLFSEFHMAHLRFSDGTPVCPKAWVEKRWAPVRPSLLHNFSVFPYVY